MPEVYKLEMGMLLLPISDSPIYEGFNAAPVLHRSNYSDLVIFLGEMIGGNYASNTKCKVLTRFGMKYMWAGDLFFNEDVSVDSSHVREFQIRDQLRRDNLFLESIVT